MIKQALDYFAALVRDDDSILLFEAALAMGYDADANLDLNLVQAEIDKMAATLHRRLPADASHLQKLRLLNHFFYRELGFCGNVNDYYNPDNSYLHRVITTRRGIPISLAMIYIELGLQIGLQVSGIAFPGHFLMKLAVPSGEIVIDPLDGNTLSREELEERLEPYVGHSRYGTEVFLAEHLHPAPARDTLVRMLHNLKGVYVDQRDWQRLLKTQERLVILLPENPAERRDRGLAYLKLECPQAAADDIEHYLKVRPDAADAETLRMKLPELRDAARRLN
jgi:regulator of sirC expression with transglutaminase-like and TPR domain